MDRLEQRHAALLAEVDRAIRPLIEAIDVETLGRVNALYRHYAADRFKHFVEIERRRWLKALGLITTARDSGTVCDLGCFIPYLPIALAFLGYKVRIADRYALYGDPFRKAIQDAVRGRSIELVDLDILRDDFAVLGQNDIVLLMAVVEHLNGTPRHLLEKIHGIVRPEGHFVFEVPNIAEFVKRLGMLLGVSPLGDYRDFYDSAYPHIGHNREMTVDEVLYMLERSRFVVEHLECYDYSVEPVRSFRGRLALLLKRVLPVRNKGESIIAVACPA